jgi:hypothetical protein
MARPKKSSSSSSKDSSANLGFEAKLWLAADTAMPERAHLPREAFLQSVREAKDHRSNL